MSARAAARGNDAIRRLLRLLQSANFDSDWPSPPSWDWLPFAAACERHHVDSFAFCRLQQLHKDSVPPGLLQHLSARFYRNSAYSFRLAETLLRLTAGLEQAGIPVMAYKGPALALALYGDLTLRQVSDLDLVIRKEHLVKAVRLMGRWGFQLKSPIFWNQLLLSELRLENPRHVARYHEVNLWSPD